MTDWQNNFEKALFLGIKIRKNGQIDNLRFIGVGFLSLTVYGTPLAMGMVYVLEKIFG